MAVTRKCPDCGAETIDGECLPCLLQLGLPDTVELASAALPLPPGGEGRGEGAAPKPAESEERQFGDYILLQELARGGMGVIFKARQVSLRRLVAIKMILGGRLAGDAEVQRFRIEAEAAANLNHPNIVPIYEIGEHEGQHYFSMRLIEGQSLAQQISKRLWRITHANRKELQRSIATLLVKVALAVHHAHQHGVLHRDIKPSNILIDQEGEPQLTDFGLAKLIQHDSGQTRSQAVMGTASYMSPEQAMGKTKEVTTAADIYSLGAVLYELLAGRPPFQGGTPLETLQAVISNDPPGLVNSNPDVDRDLETICFKCLEKDPGARYGSAEALAVDLQRWLRNEPIAARPVKIWERGVKWIRRHPVTAGLSLAVVVSLLLGFAGIAWQRHRAEQKSQFAQEQRTRSRLQRIESFFADDNGTVALAELAALVREQPANRVAAERLINALNERVLLVPSSRSIALTPARLDIAEQGTQRAEVYDKVSVRVLNSLPGAAPITFSNAHEKVIRSVRFSWDGSRLVTASGDNTAKVWDLTTNKLSFTLRHEEGVHYAEFSPDGSRIVTASRDRTARLWNAANGEPVGQIKGHLNSVNVARFSPDGQLVITGADDDTARIWEAETGRKFSEAGRLPGPVDDVYFAPDMRHIVAFSETKKPYVFRLTAGLAQIQAKPFQPSEANELAPLRERLARKQGATILSMDRTHDGTRLAAAFADQTARIWDARAFEPLTEVMVHDATVNCVRFSPDGLRLVTSTSDKVVRVWDTHTGLPLTDRIPSPQEVAAVRFSPDGEWVITAAGWKWQLAGMPGAAPAWLPDFAEAISGAGNATDPLVRQRFALLEEVLARAAGTNRLAQWAREFLKDDARSTMP